MTQTATQKTAAELKAERTALDAQLRATREAEKATKEQEKKDKESAKEQAVKDAEAKAAEDKAAREEAISTLSSAILDSLSNLSEVQIITAVNATKLASFLDTNSIDCADLKTAMAGLEATGGVKGPKASKNGDGTHKTFAASGELTAMQKRIMLCLLSQDKPCTRQTLVEAANGGKATFESGRAVTMDGNQIGQKDAATRHPLSLLGRGWVVEKEIKVEDKPVTVFALTKEGKIEAKKLAKTS